MSLSKSYRCGTVNVINMKISDFPSIFGYLYSVYIFGMIQYTLLQLQRKILIPSVRANRGSQDTEILTTFFFASSCLVFANNVFGSFCESRRGEKDPVS